MRTILVQDEDADVLEAITLTLEIRGYKVVPIANCDENLLPLIEDAKPDVVMLDFKLKGLTCIDAFKKIKEQRPKLPVIALSCNFDIHEAYKKHRFDDYVSKPYDIEELFKTVAKYV